MTTRDGAGDVSGISYRDWPAQAGLAFLVLVAIALRLIPIVFVPSMVWGDEIFQGSEQAHRLVFGGGLVPWEFQLGMRSWLLPGAIGGLMELSRLAGDGPDYYLPMIAIAFAALAAIPVVCCFLWGRRLFGPPGGWIAATAVVVAPELSVIEPFFSPTTTESPAIGDRSRAHGKRGVSASFMERGREDIVASSWAATHCRGPT